MGLRSLAVRGVVLNWIGHFSSLLITFFLTPFLVLTLGDATFGLWSIVMGLSGYYGATAAGLQGTATKYIAQFESTGQRAKIRQVVSTLVAFYSVLALGTFAVAVCVAWSFPFLFKLAGTSVETIRAVILITALNYAIQLIGKPFRSGLTAKARFDLINALNVGSQLSLALLMYLLLINGGGLIAMACATLGVGITTQLTQCWLATKLFRMNLLSPAYIERSMARELVSFGSGLFISTGSLRICNSSGVIVVGMLLGPASSAFFAIGSSLVSKSHVLLQGIQTVVFPVACRISAEQRDKDLVRMAILIPKVLLAMSLTVTIGMVIYGRPLMDLWIEPGYSDHVYELFCLLAFGATASQLGGGHRPMLIAQARIRFLAWFNSIEALLTIGLGAGLTFMFGLEGMGMAILVVRIGHGIIISNYTCRLLNYSWAKFVALTIFPCVLVGLPTLSVAVALNVINPPDDMTMLITDIMLVGIVGTISLFFICIPTDVRAAIFRALFWKVRVKPVATRDGRIVDADSSATSKIIKKQASLQIDQRPKR